MEVYNKVQADVRASMASTPYIGLTTDGWSRKIGEEHVLNFQACSPGRSIFLDMAVTAESCTGEYIASKLSDMVDTHNLSEKLVGVVTDNASNMKKAWVELAKKRNKKLICLGCIAHVLNLFLQVYLLHFTLPNNDSSAS